MEMTTQCCVLCVYFLLIIICYVDLAQTPTSGPFKVSIISVEDCTNPSKPYTMDPPIIFQSSTHNSTMSGNITFLRDTKNMKIKLKGFILRNGKWESYFLLNSLDCHGLVRYHICAALNIKYDRKNCLYFKGSYSFNNVDINQILHLLMYKGQYGHGMWRTESYSQAGTFTCKEIGIITKPA